METFTLRPVPKPPLEELSALLQTQLQFILSSATPSREEGYELTDLYAVFDASGRHVYDMHLFCDDDGQVFRAGTTEHVATFSQGVATCDDAALQDALDDALERYMADA